MKAIITADWHIRSDRPRCRLDEDWVETQRKIIEFIVDEANKKSCDIYHIGDFFHIPRQPEELVNMIIDELLGLDGGQDIFIMPGNHDLAYHSYDNLDKSSYGLLTRSFSVLHKIEDYVHKRANIGGEYFNYFIHTLTFPNKKEQIVIKDIPIGTTAEDLLEKYPEAKYIFTGDYHKNFHYEKEDRYVINPGCINRQKADMIDYKPGIYYVDTDNNIIEFIELPDKADMVTDEYIKNEKEREERISSFVEKVLKNEKMTFDFMSNLRSKLPELSGEDKNILMEVIEEVSNYDIN
jgi:DNA repair exonuclease SbcCD nuclease subunit